MDLTGYLVLSGAALILFFYLLKFILISGHGDEWILQIRNGKLKKAGIGITLWRIPGDSIICFSSAIQRIPFWTTILSKDGIEFSLRGFLMWSVSSEGDSPFMAVKKLGIGDTPHKLHNKHISSVYSFSGTVGCCYPTLCYRSDCGRIIT